MSKKVVTIELTPPRVMLNTTENEVHTSHHHICPRCGGKGWNWGRDPKTAEFIEVPCCVCQGAGELACRVFIEWKPEIKSQN